MEYQSVMSINTQLLYGKYCTFEYHSVIASNSQIFDGKYCTLEYHSVLSVITVHWNIMAQWPVISIYLMVNTAVHWNIIA